MSRTRGGLAALLTAAALMTPAVLAAPAHASTTESGCTVTPHKPTANGDIASNGQKEISYKLDISCSAGRSVYVTEERWEDDNFSSDDFLGSTPYNIHFNSTTTVSKNWVQALPTDGVGEGSDYAEVYESVSFYVVSDGNPPVTSASTWWEFSPVASIRE